MRTYAQNPIIYRLAKNHAHRLIAVAGLRSATLALWPSCGHRFMYAIEQSTCIRHVQIHSHLSKHVLVPVNFWVATYSTIQHTYQSIAVIADIYYLQYTTSNNSNMRPGFSYPGHIRVITCDPVLTMVWPYTKWTRWKSCEILSFFSL